MMANYLPVSRCHSKFIRWQ